MFFVAGATGAGKSFLVLEMARCVSTGDAFFGRVVIRKAGVVILASEGATTVGPRIEALRQYNNHQLLPIARVTEMIVLNKLADIRRLEVSLREADAKMRSVFSVPLGVLVIDTLTASFDFNDENDNSEVARSIRQLRKLAVSLHITVVVVHHYGKSSTKSVRGGSALQAAADQVLSIIPEKKFRRLDITKNRDGQVGTIGHFDLVSQELDEGLNGKRKTSMVVVPRVSLPIEVGGTCVHAQRMDRPKGQRTLSKALADELEKSGKEIALATGEIVLAAKLSGVTARFRGLYPPPTGPKKGSSAPTVSQRNDTIRRAFGRTMNDLPANIVVDTVGGEQWIWSVAGTNRTNGTNGTKGE